MGDGKPFVEVLAWAAVGQAQAELFQIHDRRSYRHTPLFGRIFEVLVAAYAVRKIVVVAQRYFEVADGDRRSRVEQCLHPRVTPVRVRPPLGDRLFYL